MNSKIINEKGAADFGRDQQPGNMSLPRKRIQQLNMFEEKPKQIPSFSLVRKTDGILTKRMSFVDGEVIKDGSGCKMSRGIAVKAIVTPEEFGSFLQGLESNQALVHGVCDYEKAALVAKNQLETKAGEEPETADGLPIMARSKDFFHYPEGPGLLMLDHDQPRENAVALDDKALKAYRPDELIDIIGGFFEALKEAARVSVCSTSSCIYDTTTGAELRGKSSGFHIYLFPQNAKDVPRFLEVLGKRLVLAGFGRVEFSRSGAVLGRTLVDLLVASPERLDFVAGAVCDEGLEQRLPAPEYVPGGLLNTEALTNLTPTQEKEYQGILEQLKEKGKPTQDTIEEEYLEQEAEKLTTQSDINIAQARKTVKARKNRVLANDDLLFFAHEGAAVKVSSVLEQGNAYGGKACADPLEPEYDGNSKTKAIFYWNEGNNPLIHSQAHGGINYQFEETPNATTAEPNKEVESPLPLTKENDPSSPFPLETLGGTMAAACRDIQRAVQAPDALIAQSVLASANLAVQPMRDVDINGRVFPLSLFFLTIAGTGERKSTVDNIAIAPHRERERMSDKGTADAFSLYEMKSSAWETEKAKIIKSKDDLQIRSEQLQQLQKQQPTKPLDQTRLISDFTFEGLYKLFKAGIPSKGLFADEGGQFSGGHGMRNETILSTATGLSKLWDGAAIDRIRVIDGSSRLYGRRLSVHLMMQDKVGLEFYNNPVLKDQGLGSRMLAAWPSSTVGSRMYTKVNALETAGVRAFHSRINALLSQPAAYTEDSNEQELQPASMRLSPEAKREWIEFYNTVEAASKAKNVLEPVRGLANKAAEHAARIAGTIQLFEDHASSTINIEAMRGGIEIMTWYLDEALRICSSFNPSKQLLDAKEVLQWIHENGLETVTLPDIYRRGPVRSAGAARKVAKVLVEHKHLIEPKPERGKKVPPVVGMEGKKSREWWSVHPESESSLSND
ncbi:MAG: DUF3987 domain-containing protein [Candidatus Electrothrix sp. AX1]|nr:DUF3987 domain-containing protein [Candidatus Electrothrix sp. AX1]